MIYPTTLVVSRYSVCPLPEDHDSYPNFEITVEREPQPGGVVLWAVRRGRYCLNGEGSWDAEPRSSEREDEWLATRRFDLEKALRLADEASARLRINGMTTADILAEAKP